MDKKNSFYSGDAAGRPENWLGLGKKADFSDSDLINVLVEGNRGYTTGGLRLRGDNSAINQTTSNNIKRGSVADTVDIEQEGYLALINSIVMGTLLLTENSVTNLAYTNTFSDMFIENDQNTTVNYYGGNLSVDAQFADTTNNDYSLSALSPCISAGIASVTIQAN